MPRVNTYKIALNINPYEILSKYYSNDSNNEDSSEDIETPVTFAEYSVADLVHEKDRLSRRSVMFLDSNKSPYKIWLNMIDIAQQGALPLHTSKPCWWCRHTFSTHPIGCPIRYHSQTNQTQEEKNRIANVFKLLNLPEGTGTDYFDTEGIFCSFPCVKAYALSEYSRTHSKKYVQSLTLLTLLRRVLCDTSPSKTPIAGDWRILAEYGGHLQIQEYRASFGVLSYSDTTNTKRPFMYPTSLCTKEVRV